MRQFAEKRCPRVYLQLASGRRDSVFGARRKRARYPNPTFLMLPAAVARLRSSAVALAFAVVAAIAVACGSGGADAGSTSPPPVTPVLTTVVVSLTTATITVGQTGAASASGVDQKGAAIGVGTVTWTSGVPTVATVKADGTVTGLTPGETQIVATVGGKQGQATITVTPVPVATVTVGPSAPTLVIGATQQLTPSVLDAAGLALQGRVVSWTTSDSTKANVNANGLVTAVAVGAATITASSEGKAGNAVVTVIAIPVTTVTVAPAAVTLAAGVSQQLTATTLGDGGAALTGRAVVWSTSDSTKATVNANGLVTAVASGSAIITATSESKTGTSAITVTTPAPVASVTIAPPAASIPVGGTVVLTATARDASGNVLSGRTWTWATNVSVTSGLFAGNVLTVTGVAPGVATVTATTDGKSGTSTVTVIAAAPVITAISPSTLTPGGTVTVVGTGFAATPGDNTLSIGGVDATITSGSTTQLFATVPCVAGGSVPVVTSIAGISSNTMNANLVGTTQTLAVGQSIALLSEASVRCNELAVTGGRYLISVFNTSTAPSANTPVIIRGASAVAAPIGSTAATAAPIATPLVRGAAHVPSRESAVGAANARAHATVLERDRDIYLQMRGTPGLAEATRMARTRAATRANAIPLTVGASVSVRYGGFASAGCNSYSKLSARVVSVTPHGVVLEDIASPTAGTVDAELIAFGQLFESTLYPIEANFGDINAYDVAGALDNPGRVLMLFTPQENRPFPGGGVLLGHVTACDLFPPTLAGTAASNQTKIFYARVPTTLTGSADTLDSKAWWKATMPGTLVHEAKHLTSYAERFSRNAAVLEESWLEEATAQIAPEIYSRRVYPGTSWKTNTTYANSLFCDAHIGSAQCPAGQFLMENHFNFLLEYYQYNDSKSILWPASFDGDIYGSAWMFARWLVDQYGGATESALLRSLVQEANLTGVGNVTAKTGQSFATLLADWTMTLIADDYPGFTPPAGAKYTFPSWNTRSIWAGFNADRGTPLFPLHVNRESFGPFALSGTLPGAAAGIIELSGVQTAKQLLNLSLLPAGTTIRMSILRVQ